MLEIFKTLARSVFGMNHVANHENQYLEIVGNGLDAEHPRNARTLDIAGNEVLAGRLTVGAQPEGDNDVATKKYVDDNAGGGGGGDNVFVISGTLNLETYETTMDKTVQEIINAANAGKVLWLYEPSEGSMPMVGPVVNISENEGVYMIGVAYWTTNIDGGHTVPEVIWFYAQSLSAYATAASF